MRQQINLFNPSFRKQRMVVSTMTVVYCTALTLLVLLAFQTYFNLQIKGLNEELRSAQNLATAQLAYVNRVKSDRTRKPSATLEADIAQMESELKLARESIETLNGGALGNQQGFAEYLRAFSRQSLNGLWLTGFTIAGGGEISIHGRTIQAELVPNYIQRLNREKVLQGRSFSSLNLSTPKAEPVAAGQTKELKAPPRYLEFSLMTAEPQPGAGAGRAQ